jgi:ABC-type iron transport system FetAB ATPase subunit
MLHDMPTTSAISAPLPGGAGAPAAPAVPRLAIRGLASSHAGPVSFDLGAGECLAIVGESGSGKSVLLRMIADLDPNEGAVLLDGVGRESWPAPAWRATVVYQAAEPAWWEPTAAAHLKPDALPAAEALAAALRLKAGALSAELALLSTGERQRLALIRSLARRPQVLLLDEPASALDAAATLALETVLRAEMERGMAIIVVTHSEPQAERLAQRRLRMAAGQLEAA